MLGRQIIAAGSEKEEWFLFLSGGEVTFLLCYYLELAEQQGLFSVKQEVSILWGMWLRCYEWMQSPRSQLGHNCHQTLEQRHVLSLQPESIHLIPPWDPGSLKTTDTFLMRGWTVNRAEALFWVLTYMKRCHRIFCRSLVLKLINVKDCIIYRIDKISEVPK